jgi:hypothetical protein
MKFTVLVKIFLILNLIISTAAVWVGFSTFRTREVIKARTVILKDNLGKVADRLGYGEQQPWESSAQGGGRFLLPTIESAEQIPTLTATLETLETLASTRSEQLAETFENAQVAKANLETERTNLAATESKLDSTRTEVAGLETTLADVEQKVEVAASETSTLQRETQRLESQVEDLNQQTSRLQEQTTKTREMLNLRTIERDRMEELLAACRQPRTNDGSTGDWHQKTAQILAADPEWNYVVINKGEVDVLPMYLEAFVHRGDDFLGKIRVIQVENTVALAEVLPETLAPGVELQSGDTIFF